MPELFESHAKRNIDPKKWLIGAAAFIVLACAGYGLFVFTKPKGPTADDILAVEVRDAVVMLLDYKRFSGEEFRAQMLGKGRLETHKRSIDEVLFTYPRSSGEEFLEFINSNFYDIRKVEFGTEKDGEIKLGDYSVPAGPNYGQLFRTNLANIKIDHRRNLKFDFKEVSYSPSLEEIKNFTTNSMIYGGRMLTQVPERSFKPSMFFANHGIMVAKPDEPSLKRLADDILKNAGPDREARIQKLVDFVSNEIEFSYSEALGGRETLKRGNETLMTRTGDCSNKTILLASLLEQIGEDYILLYCPRHITVAVPQGNFQNTNKLDFTWDSKNWMIAETTLAGFQIGQTLVNEPRLLTRVEYVQNPKNADVIIDANSFEVLKFL